jgi:nucleoside-diphosphate-sugar epimerase
MLYAVSGAGGYVGNVLVRHLLGKGHKVRAMDNFHKGHCDGLIPLASNQDFEFIYGDVTRFEDCRRLVDGVDGVIHLAAIVGFPACKRQPILSRSVNVDGTLNMLSVRNAINKNMPFVFASTGSVYGKVTELCTEETSTNPQSQYGIDKLTAEQAVRANNNTVSLRFATGFGISPCMRVNLLVNDLVYQAYHNNSFTLFEAEAKRTFIHVYDMARCFEWALRQCVDTESKVFNAGDSTLNWSKRQLAEYIKEQTRCYVTYAEIGKDADQRDYEVSFKKLNDNGFICYYNMKKGIDELIKAAPLLRVRNPYD